MSEVRKEIRERFLSFLFTEIRKGKHMKKKMVAVLLAAGLVISLAACGGASETGNTAETKTENEETAGDEPEEEAENTEESTLVYGCRTDFADIQNKKECGGNRQWQHHYLRKWAADTKGKAII